MFGVLVFAAFCVQLVAAQAPKVLIFSATLGFRHASIPVAIQQLQLHGPEYGITFDNTEDPKSFNASFLNQYDAIMFLMNTDDKTEPILNPAERDAFQAYLNNGGNFMGVHAASYCLQTSPFYEAELGAYFEGHPPLAPATFIILEPTHPTVNMVPERWSFREEVYNFQSDPRKHGAKVVITVEQDNDEFAKQQGSPHPIAWYQERGAGVDPDVQLAGRSFYTSLGHMNSTWKDPVFMGHIMGGVTWIMDGNTTLAYNQQAKVGNAAGFGAPRLRPTSTTSSMPGPTQSTDGSTTNNNNVTNAAQTFAPAWSAAFLVFAASLLFIHGF